VRIFAEHGIELLIVDEESGPTNILTFFGTAPDLGESDGED
jgi:hypothetical protein